MRWHLFRVSGLIFALFGQGCALVDPQGDYAQVAHHVQTAVGDTLPERAPSSASIVEDTAACLADGLTSDEAVQIALLNNPRVRSGFASIGMARADVVQSGLFTNPSLSLAARFPDGGGLANIDAGLGQNIADLWLIPARRRAAEEDLNRQILVVARDVSNLALATRSAYCRAVSAVREREIAAENLDVARRLVESAEARQQAGMGNVIDVNLAKAGALDSDLELRISQLAESQARRDLGALLGLAGPLVAGLTEPLPEPPDWTLAEDLLLSTANASRLDLLSAGRAVAAAEARLEQEERSVFSNVEIGVAMERSERRRDGNSNPIGSSIAESIRAGQPTAVFSPEEDESEDVITGPSLSVDLPIFDQNQAQIAKARYAVEVAKSERDALAIEITQEALSAYDRAKTAWGISNLHRNELLPLLEENLELSREAYRAGKVSFLSVLETQQRLLLSRGRFLQALRDSTTAVIDLERAVGRPMRDLLSPQAPMPPAGGANGRHN